MARGEYRGPSVVLNLVLTLALSTLYSTNPIFRAPPPAFIVRKYGGKAKKPGYVNTGIRRPTLTVSNNNMPPTLLYA